MQNDDTQELEKRCEDLIQTLPLQSLQTMLIILIPGAVLFASGVFGLTQLPANPSGWDVGLAVTFAVTGGATMVFMGILFLDRRFRRKTFREMLSGQPLAHWSYTTDEWASYCSLQNQRRDENTPFTSSSVIAWLLIGGIFAGLTMLISWNWGEHRGTAIGIAFASGVLFAVLMTIFEWLGWTMWCRALENRQGETFIMPGCVYFHSRLHSWGHWGGRLKSLTHEKQNELPLSILKFEVAVISKNGEHIHHLEVPVPREKQEEADRILQELQR
ncbi:MFS transporter [Rubinisphaera italica]|uniref:Uncharacterized protein n=1 Tax=Rubinisphaera italica TaxID=2527969 RepID=A0A5C5XM83_9PLAN|nr:MFS transporter [Rubinisphaera italica]TWT64267.1 hypothetical protein Pan54_50290 [Rubinisphaera italica]